MMNKIEICQIVVCVATLIYVTFLYFHIHCIKNIMKKDKDKYDREKLGIMQKKI